jgi:hypothetical protein
MISEMTYLFFVGMAVVFFLVGVLARKYPLTIFSAGLFFIMAMMSGNVGNPDGTALYTDYILLGYIMIALAIIAVVTSFVQMFSSEV